MTIASLAISAGWMAGSARQPQPARRATDDDVVVGHEHEHEQHHRHEQERHRREAQVAVVDPHHRHHRDRARAPPTGSAGRRSRTCPPRPRRSRASPTTSRPSGCRWPPGRRRARGSGSRARGARAAGPGSATWPASGWRSGGRRGRRARAWPPGRPGRRPKRGMGGARFIDPSRFVRWLRRRASATAVLKARPRAA